jgi:hypothetical protein
LRRVALRFGVSKNARGNVPPRTVFKACRQVLRNCAKNRRICQEQYSKVFVSAEIQDGRSDFDEYFLMQLFTDVVSVETRNGRKRQKMHSGFEAQLTCVPFESN